MNSNGFLSKLARRFRSVMSSFTDKPAPKLDEYELDHLLLYHGLVGTSPENQKSFRDVRADIAQAVERRNSVEMSIALKLQPLWWEDKLHAIFSEMDRAAVIDCLLPQGLQEEIPPAADPLRSEDWRVQSNAGRILAFFRATEAAPTIARAMHAAVDNNKAAFCHLALALGSLGEESSKAELERYLFDEEPWFRVDAANALASWPIEETGPMLSRALQAHHLLSDYQAVAIARKHRAASYLSSSDEELQAGGEQLVLGVLSAAHATFPSELVEETGIDETWPMLVSLYKEKPNPRLIRSILIMSRWLEENRDHPDWLNESRTLKDHIHGDGSINSMVESQLKQSGADSRESDLRDAIALSGELRFSAAASYIEKLLKPGFLFLNEAIDALGAIGQPSSSPALMQLARQMVDGKQRASQEPSSQPVLEASPDSTRSYWHVLRALGKIPHEDAVPFLLMAASDFAPDKRQQAVESLIEVYERLEHPTRFKSEIVGCASRLLSDPSVQVKIAALDGLSRLDSADALPEILKLSDAREPSLSKKAFQTLEELYRHGHKEVVGAIESRLKREHNSFKRRQLEDFLRPLR